MNKNIIKMLGIRLEHELYYNQQIHLFVEHLDKHNKLHLFIEDNKTDKSLIDFINYHIEKTTPVFGKWNYTKYLDL